MNSGAKIIEQQLLDSNKMLLAAQRQIYSDAKMVDAAAAFVCLGLPLAITLAQIFLQIEYWFIVVADLLFLVIGFALSEQSKMLSKLAAGVQQELDARVFGIKFENTLIDRTVVSRYTKKYQSRHGDLSDLDRWYTAPIEGLGAGEAIALCQRQNARWTGRLMGRYLAAEALLAVVMGVALVLLVAYKGADPSSLSFLLPIIEWVLIRLIRGARTWHRARKIARDIPEYRLTSRDSIIAVQQKIFDYRSVAFLVPDWFYRLFKGSDDEQSVA